MTILYHSVIVDAIGLEMKWVLFRRGMHPASHMGGSCGSP
jgi:hypothetical protein